MKKGRVKIYGRCSSEIDRIENHEIRSAEPRANVRSRSDTIDALRTIRMRLVFVLVQLVVGLETEQRMMTSSDPR